MTNETNRFTRHPKCERCGFKYGFHICVDLSEPRGNARHAIPKEQWKRYQNPRKPREITDELREKLQEHARNRYEANQILNAERNENIARDYEENWLTLRQLGDKYKMTKDTVRKILEYEGVPIRLRGETRESRRIRDNIDEIASDYRSGLSRRELARKWVIAESTLNKALIKAGVDMRPPNFKTAKRYTFN